MAEKDRPDLNEDIVVNSETNPQDDFGLHDVKNESPVEDVNGKERGRPSGITAIFKKFFKAFWVSGELGRFYSYSNLIFFLPLMAIGFGFDPMVKNGWIGSETAVWFWVGAFLYGILAGCVKPGPIACGFLIAGTVGTIFAAKYYQVTAGFMGLEHFISHFADKDLQFTEMFSLISFTLSEILSFMLVFTVIWTRLDKKYIAQNTTVKRDIFWGGYRVIASETRNIDSRYPNLAGALMGIGTIIVEKNGKIIDQIDNVLLLPFRIKSLQRSLGILLTKAVK